MNVSDWDNLPPVWLERAEQRIVSLFLQACHREGLLPSADLQSREGVLVWQKGTERLCVRGQEHASGHRLSVSSLPWRSESTTAEPLGLEASVTAVAGWQHSVIPEPAWKALIEELKQGVTTQAAAYLAALSKPEPQSWLDFEGWIPEGHNLHPGAKTRAGFSVADQLAYAPEFAGTIELPWISVAKELLQASGELPKLFDAGSHWTLPVHPWQLRESLPRTYATEWESGAIKPLERSPLRARLLTSLRTVVPEDETLPILKLSVGSLMTSTERSMSRHTVLHGPLYSEHLRRVVASEPPWASQVDLMHEDGGLCWSNPEESGPRARHLSFLLRQRLREPLGLTAVPCCCLPQPSGPDLSSSHLVRLFSQGAGPLTNFAHYCRLLIPFHLIVYLEAGLALEAHLQNCLVLWSCDGAPQRLWVRDWGGLRADPTIMARLSPDLVARLDPRAVTVSDGTAARRKLIACLYSNHLAEIVVGLARGFSLPENALWAVVEEVSRSTLAARAAHPLAREVLADEWPVKTLLSHRLLPQAEEYSWLPNPLSQL